MIDLKEPRFASQALVRRAGCITPPAQVGARPSAVQHSR